MSTFVRIPPLPPALRFFPLLSALTLGGCMSMSGLGGDSKYACKAPEGVACDSVSGTYANAVANNLPSQRKRQFASKQEAPIARSPAARTGPLLISSPPPAAVGDPLRSPARYLRLWIKPWEDIDGDLYDQAHVYVQIDQGRWLIDHVQQRIRDAYAPLRPPPSSTGPSSTPDGGSSPAQSPGRPILPAPARLLNNAGETPQ